MSRFYLLTAICVSVLVFSGCSGKKLASKPNPYPKNPRYEIVKPQPKFQPNQKNLAKMVNDLEGRPYVWAEEGPECFDCSGYTYYLYGKMGIEIPRVAREQIKSGLPVETSDLKYGDLIFFDTTKNKSGRISHVGMYLGDGWFTHASTTDYKVKKDNIYTSNYYQDRYRGARRYLGVTQEQIYLAKQQSKQPAPAQSYVAQAPTTTNPTVATQQQVQNTAPANTTVAQSTQQGYYVQLGLFSQQPNSSLLDKIREHGYGYTLLSIPEEQVSKLLIGPFTNRDDANNTLLSVKQKITNDAFITKISS